MTNGRGALLGLVAAGSGLAAAELVLPFIPAARSPVIDIGDRFIDVVPAGVKDAAIALFGTADKVALLVGMGLVLAVGAALIGVVAMKRSLGTGLVLIAILGGLGAAAALMSGRGLTAAVPSFVTVLVGSGVLALLRPRAHESVGRRAFLKSIAAVAAGALVAGVVGRRMASAATPVLARLRAPDVALPAPVPSLDVPGISPLYTSNADFYRIDTALQVPRIPVDRYTLSVTGMVERPFTLTFDELVSRRLIEADITLSCVSNEIGGGLVGNARWLGTRLDDLLDEAGVDPRADQVIGRSVDGYTCGFPVAALDGRNALVAIGMNGGPLPEEHGFPARLVVPGLYGYVSATKWLVEIELGTFADFDHYWVPRGWDSQAPIKTQSRIDVPAGLSQLEPGPAVIAGVAWAQTRGVTAVEVKIDDKPWEPAVLAEAINDDTWRQWTFAWEAGPGRHEITCRATDGEGEVQTAERAQPAPNGASGRHSIIVLVSE